MCMGLSLVLLFRCVGVMLAGVSTLLIAVNSHVATQSVRRTMTTTEALVYETHHAIAFGFD